MPEFFFEVPTYIVLKHIHMNQERIYNARIIIDESKISGGTMSDLQLFLSNDPEGTNINNRLWVEQSTNGESIVFPTTSTTDDLYAKIYGKPGVQLLIEDSTTGKSFPIQIKYNELV